MSLQTADKMNEGSTKICSECGQTMNEKIETYLIECDYCLSKRTE